jgi:hypothetical protein
MAERAAAIAWAASGDELGEPKGRPTVTSQRIASDGEAGADPFT